MMLYVDPSNRSSSDSILYNLIVIKNSSSILVEDEVGRKKKVWRIQHYKIAYII